jgi:DNA-binding NtrC family response regulator
LHRALSLAFFKCLIEQESGFDSGDRDIKEAIQKGHLVLLEPDGSVRDALSLLLGEKGWAIRLAADCTELQSAIEQCDPTAVISESKLPGCTPQEILEVCSANNLPVVFTGHDLPLQGAVDLIRQGAMDYLDKPFPQSRLVDLLERLASGQNG